MKRLLEYYSLMTKMNLYLEVFVIFYQEILIHIGMYN